MDTTHYYTTEYCREGAARVRQRHALSESRRAHEVGFTVNGEELEQVSRLTYLGRYGLASSVLQPDESAQALDAGYLLGKELTRESAECFTRLWFNRFYSTVATLQALEGFHNRMARRLSGMRPYLHPVENEWVYPPIAEALEEAGVYPIEHYIRVRQNTLAVNIATRPILELCRESEQLSGSIRRLFCWTQQDLGGTE